MSAVPAAAVSRLARLLPQDRDSRLLTTAGIVDAVGTALYYTGGVLFFVRVIGLSTSEVGFGLSAAALTGMLVQPALGWAGDRVGPRRMLIVVNLVRAAGFVSYTVARTFSLFFVIAIVLATCEQGQRPLMQSLAERVAGSEGRVGLLARVRVSYNVGYALGGVLATIALGVGTRAVFIAMFLANAATFVVVSALLPYLRMTWSPSTDEGAVAGRGPRLPGATAIRNLPYLRAAALNGVLMMHISLLGVAMPLWIVYHTHAPASLVGVLFIINTVIAIVLQMPVSRFVRDMGGSVAVMRWAGFALAVSSLLFIAAGRGAIATAIILSCAAIVALTLGEVLQSAAGWSLAYQLTPGRQRTEHLAVFNLGASAQNVLGPVLATSVLIRFGWIGWTAMAGVFLFAGFAMRRTAVSAAKQIHDGG